MCARATRAIDGSCASSGPTWLSRTAVAGARAGRRAARRRPRCRRHRRRADRRRPRRVVGRPRRRAALGPRRRRRSKPPRRAATAARSQFDATGRAGDGVLTLAGTTELDAGCGLAHAAHAARRRGAHRATAGCRDLRDAGSRRSTSRCRPSTSRARVHVPRASLELDALPAQAVTPSPRRRRARRNERVTRSRPLQLRTAIELTLGDDVRYAALNLDTTVGGELRSRRSRTLRRTRPARSSRGNLRRVRPAARARARPTIVQRPARRSRPRRARHARARATTSAARNEVGVELTGTVAGAAHAHRSRHRR